MKCNDFCPDTCSCGTPDDNPNQRTTIEVTPPSGDLNEAQEAAAHTLYSLIMNVAEVTADGYMPAAGPTSLTKIGACDFVDNLVHLVQIATEQNVCPLCRTMNATADKHHVPFQSNHTRQGEP